MKETPTQTLVNTILALSREIASLEKKVDDARREMQSEKIGSSVLQNQIAARDQMMADLNTEIAAAKAQVDSLTANAEQWKAFYDRKSDELARHVSEQPKLQKLHQAAATLVLAIKRVTATKDVDHERYAVEAALADTENYLEEIPF